MYAIFGCNSAGSFDSTVGTADAYIFASQIAKHDILVHVNLVELLTVNISFFNIDVVAAYHLAVFACFGCYCMQLAAVYCVSRISGYCACCYTGNLTVFSNSYFAQLSTFSSDLAVVAACIAYKQLAVAQCRMTGEYTVIQYYVTDFACGCGYFAVFIYGEVVVCTIECTVAVYEERHNTVFICSTYGQVVFCVQGIGLDGVYTGHVAFFIDSYLTKLSGFRSDLAVVAVCIAYEQFCITQCGMTGIYAVLQNYVADFAFSCGYFAVFIYNQFAVGSIECAVAVYEERHGPIYICSAYGQIVFGIQCIGLNGVCICITIFIYREFAVCCIKCAVAVYEERRSTICFCSTYRYAACCYTAACPDSAFAAADAYKSVRIISCKSNIIIQSNLIFLATVFIEAFGYSNISITIGNSTVFECFCFYTFQLTYIHCIGIIDTRFDIYDTASDTSFTRLPYRFADGNDTVFAITRQDVSLFYPAGIAKSGRIFRTRNPRIVTNG